MDDSLIIVDRKNEIMGWGGKSEIELLDMSFRCVHILVFLPDKRIVLPRFSMNKVKFPNMIHSSATGYVKRYEEYTDAAKRALWECLGIKKEELKEVGSFKIEYKKCLVFHKVYTTEIKNEKEITLNPLEFQNYEKKDIESIIEDLEKNRHKYTNSFLKSFEFIKKEKKKLFIFNNFK
ncbi:MAG: NUDIX domain-containing protein [Candidatus Micrarchaeia archaeon]|jgi:isopentenyldiphosphate isomerase